jgi:hypothetical protein
MMILDAMIKIKSEIDPTLTFRRSCRERERGERERGGGKKRKKGEEERGEKNLR